jgi:prepilin-type N-terminal cleavage/methylation domain-containing protein
MRISKTSQAGFTLVEIMIVLAIMGLLPAIGIPNSVKARERSQTNTCIANLKQIEGGKEVWALEIKAAANATPTWSALYPDYIKSLSATNCPAGGTVAINSMTNRPTCTTSGHVLP